MQSDDEFEFSAEDDLSCLQALIETETQLATGLLDGTDAKDADADADARKHHSEEVDDDFENEFEDLALVDVPLHLLDESVHKTPVPPLPSCGVLFPTIGYLIHVLSSIIGAWFNLWKLIL